MNLKPRQIGLTAGVIIVSILLIALGFLGFSLIAGLLIICVLWAIYFYLMTR